MLGHSPNRSIHQITTSKRKESGTIENTNVHQNGPGGKIVRRRGHQGSAKGENRGAKPPPQKKNSEANPRKSKAPHRIGAGEEHEIAGRPTI